MKKLFLALLAAATVTSASAQANSWLLYGDLSFSSVSSGSLSTTSWGINPGIGYQLDNNWTLGLNLGYTSVDSTSINGFKSSMWGVGPFARYTHTMGSMFYCFGQANVMYASYSQGGNDVGSSIGINIVPAVGMNVGKGYALNFSLGGVGYTSYNPKGGGTSTGIFALNFGQTLSIGLSKNFACMKHKAKHEAGDERKMDGDDDAPKKGKKAKKDKDDE